MKDDAVEAVLDIVDELNPADWRSYTYDQQSKRLADLNALQGAIEGVLAQLDRAIRTHERSDEYQSYTKHKADKDMLTQRHTRLQRMCTQLQSLLKMP